MPYVTCRHVFSLMANSFSSVVFLLLHAIAGIWCPELKEAPVSSLYTLAFPRCGKPVSITEIKDRKSLMEVSTDQAWNHHISFLLLSISWNSTYNTHTTTLKDSGKCYLAMH
jgi:hypothetical protein